MILLIIGLILFIGLVIVHEMGHFFAARRNGVDVEEFGIGFPPKVWSKQIKPKDEKKSPWLFTVNLLPLGGFVRLKGENDAANEKGTFGAASLRGKTEIMVAGVLMNLITAVLLLMLLAWLGMPRLIENQFTVASDTKVVSSNVLLVQVEENSPADKAGLQVGDQIRSFTAGGEERKIENREDLVQDVTSKFAGEEIVVKYERSGETREATATLLSAEEVERSRNTDNPKGYLGVVPNEYAVQRSTWSAPIVALGLTKQFTELTFQGLGRALSGVGNIFAGAAGSLAANITSNEQAREDNRERRQQGQTTASSQVAGPLGIFVVLRDGSILGYQYMLLIIAIISLTLAIMNFLPIPALDGGRLWLTLGSAAFGKTLSKETEELINGIGFLFLLMLIALITFVDYNRFF